MLKLLRQGKAKGVVIHKIDRSARNLKDWADLGELIDQGIEVHFANESLDLHSRSGRLSADIQAVVAADYIRNLREEAKKGIYGRLKQGFYPLRAPIGYLDNGAGKAKTIDPEKGSLVKKAFDLYATATYSIPTLVAEMYRLGLRNVTGNRVTRNGIAKMLRNPFYTGVIRIKKTGEFYQGNHEPLISTALFRQVQDVLTGRFHTRSKHHEFLFRRTVRCALCGFTLIGELKKGHVYYRCHTKECPTTGIREEAIQVAMIETLRKLDFTADEWSYLLRTIQELKERWLGDKEQVMKNLNAKLQIIAERLRKLTDAYLDGVVERDLYEERKGALLFERQSAQGSLQDFQTNRASVPDALKEFLELAGNAQLLFQEADYEQKRRMVKRLTSNFTMRDKKVVIAYQTPFDDIANREKNIDGGPSYDIPRTWKPILEALIKRFNTEPGAMLAN
jgi:site-specific DNA recombinase